MVPQRQACERGLGDRRAVSGAVDRRVIDNFILEILAHIGDLYSDAGGRARAIGIRVN